MRVALILSVLWAPTLVRGTQYSFKIYSQPEGLRNQVINCLIQDRNGFLWTGTENGLYRYDGYRFAFFGQADGLPDNTIQSLYESSDGTLWVGTRLGVATWNGRRFVPDRVLGKAELFGHSNIVSDPSGRIYIGTARGLAVRDKDAGVTQFRYLTTESVYGVYMDPSGTLWFGASGLLWSFQADTRALAPAGPGAPKDRWDSMLVDREGNFWIRSSELLMVRRKGSRSFEAVPGISHSPEFGFLYQTRDGRVFVPTDGGLMGYSRGRWERIGSRQGLVSDEATCLFQDREGSVWVGLGGEGLERWIGFGEWEGWTTSDGLASNIVWDLQRDNSGRLWAATEDGLHMQDRGTLNWTLKSARALSVRTVLDDASHDALWYGANPGGVFRLDRKTGQLRHFGLSAGLKNERIDKLFWDSRLRLWATTRGGIFVGTVRGDRVHFEQELVPYTDPNEAFYGYLLDHRGRVWIGGSRGLVVLENGQWRRISKSDGLIGEGVSHIAETPDGAIWFGYLTNSGVTRLVFEKGEVRFNHFTTTNGLISNGSVFVGSDVRGWLWVGTDNGVDVLADGTWRHYGKPDGLIWDDCDALAFHADSDGSVWIGTSGGVSHFHPLTATRSQVAPTSFITSIESGKRVLDPGKPERIDYQDRFLSIRFATPIFLNEAAVRFRYRMLGFEQDWVDTDEHWVRYPNLPAGDYNFEVIARNAQGKWSRKAASVPITILAPWWQTWKFRALASLLLAGLAHRLWRFRIRYLLEKQERLESLLSQAQTADRLKSEALVKITRAEAREKNRNRVLELVGSHESLATVLDSIIEMVELDDPHTCCLILILNGGQFRHGASRRLAPSFGKSFDGLGMNSSATCFARAALRVETVEVSQMAGSPLWDAYVDSLVPLQLDCSLSAPIVSSSADVLGTITFFRRDEWPNASGQKDFLESAARLASIAMEHLSLYEQLCYRAQYDVLTELPNRALFGDRLEQAIARAGRQGRKIAVLMLDLDGFKFVNDTLGHQAGDLLLQTVARRIRACLRKDDTAARMGGDEFTLLIETANCADIEPIIQKLIVAISQPVMLGDQEAFVTASVGVSIYPDDSRNAAELIKNADLAMYHVKRLGKNAHDFFAPEMATTESGRIEIETHLRYALAGHEFEVYYQPQFKLDKTLCGFEALLRWTNPVLGAVSPARFIPVAETTGLIVPLGHWVLEEACRQTAVWRAAGLMDFRMAVNVSARQFARPDFPETVAQALRAAGISPRNIELELTETAIMSDVTKSSAQLRELRESGVAVAIDDFGTGYSSLSYLQRLPVDSIKIDQSFVQGLSTGLSNSLRMIQAIVNLAHDLNLRVIAEGVETEDQLRSLRAAQCDFAQGYLLGKPLKVRDATALLELHTASFQISPAEELVLI